MNYSEAQLEIINTIDGNIGVIASAGSGKTTVLTKRIENMVKNHSIAPQDILAVTFSKKAKENIQDKLKELNVNGVNIETFHSLALKIIGTRYGVGYFKVWTLQWEKEKIMQTICYDRMNLCSKDDVPYNDILRFIGKQKNAMLSTTDELIYSDDDPFSKNNMKEIFVSYEKFKEENRYIELYKTTTDNVPFIVDKNQESETMTLSLTDDSENDIPVYGIIDNPNFKKISVDRVVI